MPIPKRHLAPLLHGEYYHIVNHAVGSDNLFYYQENYRYFLMLLDEYVGNTLDIYAWCLMPNHFHLLARVKAPEEVVWPSTDDPAEKVAIGQQQALFAADSNAYLVEVFRRFFMRYALAVNKQQNRKGSLFCSPFRRIWVNTPTYLDRVVQYIHANPVKHGFVNDLNSWPWSSYNRMLLPQPSKLHKQPVIEWFGGKAQYIASHQQPMEDAPFCEGL